MSDADLGPTATYAIREVEDEVGVLTVVDGEQAGLEQDLGDDPVRVGSGPVADLRLSDRAVSRLHCELSRAGERVRLRDLGSKNGTWVAGCRIHDAELTAGTRLRVGATTLELTVAQRRVRKAVWTGDDRFGPLRGASAAMHRIFPMLAKMAGSDAPVLIRGETGTGKDVVARALHEQGLRANGPFVVVDGGALAHTLADSELFGHERGAFTGATDARAGAFERAHGGTVFLDEIADLPPEVQPKLLRALEQGTVRRLGGSEMRQVDVRIVAATHRPLEQMINDGAFREDLLHRLRVFEVRLPPLRERPEDVSLLARVFLSDLAPGDERAAEQLEQALAARAGYRWPGNVRELRAFVRRLAALGDAELGRPETPADDAPLDVRVDAPLKEAKRQWVEALERQYIARLLAETGGNVSEAARRAEMDRGHLTELADRYGLRRSQ